MTKGVVILIWGIVKKIYQWCLCLRDQWSRTELRSMKLSERVSACHSNFLFYICLCLMRTNDINIITDTPRNELKNPIIVIFGIYQYKKITKGVFWLNKKISIIIEYFSKFPVFATIIFDIFRYFLAAKIYIFHPTRYISILWYINHHLNKLQLMANSITVNKSINQ